MKSKSATTKARKAEIVALAKQQEIREIALTSGNCAQCPVSDACEYVDDNDSMCKLVAVSTQQVLNEVALAPRFKREDALAARNLAVMYSSIVFSELFFEMYRPVGVKKGDLAYSDMYKEYLKLVTKFNDMLSGFGMTPMGRRKLQANVLDGVGSPTTVLETYVNEQYGKEKTEGITGQDRHNSVLPGQESPKPALAGYSGSYTASDVRPKAKSRPKKTSKKHGGRAKSKSNRG